MSLKITYRFIAPFYDAMIARASAPLRPRSLAALATAPEQYVLLSGAGTGLDFPFLPAQHQYVALDLAAAMQARSHGRERGLRLSWALGDSMALPFADASFDCVVLHLILAVVPHPQRCLAETARVLKPGGRVLVLDKFLRPGQLAPMRRLLNLVAAQVATRLDVVFEEVLGNVPQLRLVSDQPALAHGWFRLIELAKD